MTGWTFCVLLLHVISKSDYAIALKLIPPENWNTGRIRCEELGMEMATITNVSVMEKILEFLPSQQLLSSISEVWIGLKWNASEKYFQWLEGTKLGNYQPWASIGSEPNCMDGESGCEGKHHCVRIDTKSWRTMDCLNEYPVLCMNRSTLPDEPVSNQTDLINPVLPSTTVLTARTNLTSCLCPCTASPFPITYDNQQLLDLINSLKIDWKDTGAAKRSRTSAEDNRLSSRVMGYTASALISVVLGLVLLSDCTRGLMTK